jgi:hypothetical protein
VLCTSTAVIANPDLPNPLPESSWETAYEALKIDPRAPLPQFVNLGLNWDNFFNKEQMANALARCRRR